MSRREKKIMVKNDKLIPTNCTAYFLPMLFKELDDIPMYKGTFVGDEEKPELNHHIFILCTFHGSIDQKAFEDYMSDSDLFVTLYYPDDYTTMFVYDIPPEREEDYNKCMAGKYSKLSDEFKKKIVRFWKLNEQDKYYQIIYKSPERKAYLEDLYKVKLDKDAELGTIFSKESDWFSNKFKVKKLGGFESGREGT